MVVGMSMLTMLIVVMNAVVVSVVVALLHGRTPARIVVPVVSLIVLSAVGTAAAARSLGRLELQWDQYTGETSTETSADR